MEGGGAFRSGDNTLGTRLYQLNSKATGDIKYALGGSNLLQYNYIKYDSKRSVINEVDGYDQSNFVYTWYADGVEITGELLKESGSESNSKLWLRDQYYVGKYITLEVTFTDNRGNQESLSVTTDERVANQNDSPKGELVLEGQPIVGETLYLSTDQITDEDGMSSRSFAYTWYRNGSKITGEDSSSYIVVAADLGKEIKAKVSFYDDYGEKETIYSKTVTIAAAKDENEGNSVATADIFISGFVKEDELLQIELLNVSDKDGLSQAEFVYQWYADDEEIVGATAESYRLTQQEVDKEISVKVIFSV